MIQVKRVYDLPDASDGLRILVDRVWPRGVKKEAVVLDEWRRDLAPSADLRKWFGHDPEKWERFKARYFRELSEAGKGEDLRALAALAARRKVSLLYGAADREHNQAVALRDFMEEMTSREEG